MCKIITKLLNCWIKGVIGNLIMDSLSSFIEDGCITNNILFALELFKVHNRKGISPRCVLKVDIRKAYDSLDWYFLERLLIELGFPNKFVVWIMTCIFTVPYFLTIIDGLMAPFLGRGASDKRIVCPNICLL